MGGIKLVKYIDKDAVYFNLLSKSIRQKYRRTAEFYNCPAIYNNFFDKTGYKLYLVGGAIRDSVSSKVNIHDYDFASACPASMILAAYPDAKLVGESFEVVLLPINGKQYEIARFRSETNHDGRRCDCNFDGVSLEADLSRRDLTINAISFDPYLKITYDPHDGLADSKNNIIRFVGDANERIIEDNLRIFRAIRFKYKYGANYDINTYHSILGSMQLLSSLPKERLYSELVKLNETIDFVGDDDNLDLLSLFSTIFGKEFTNMLSYDQNSKYHDFTLDVHSLLTYKYARNHLNSNNHILKVAALLHDIGKPDAAEVNPNTGFTNYIGHAKVSATIAREILTKLKFPKIEINKICELIEFHDMVHYSDLNTARKMILEYKLKYNDFRDLISLQYADELSKKKDNTQITETSTFTKIRIHTYKDLGKLILPIETSNEGDALFTVETLIKFGIDKTKLREALDELVIWCIKKVVVTEGDYRLLKPSEYKNRLKVLAIKYK